MTIRTILPLLLGAAFLSGAAFAQTIDRPTCRYRDAATDGAGSQARIWLLCDRDQVVISSDGGANWSIAKTGSIADVRAIAFADARRGFIGGESGTLLATEDGGRTWTKVAIEADDYIREIFFRGEQGWIGGDSGLILHTTDGGRTWNRQKSGTIQSVETIYFADAQHGWAVGWVGLMLRTNDGGQTWEQVRSPAIQWSLHSVYFRDTKDGWATGMLGQLLRSRDGGVTWQQLAVQGKPTLGEMLILENGRGWIAADENLLETSDGGETWKPAGVTDWVSVDRLFRAGNNVFALGQFALLRYADGKWIEVRVVVPSGSGRTS